MSAEKSNQPNQPFTPQTERPGVKLNLDTPLSKLRVRDLSMILSEQLGRKSASAIEQFSYPPKTWGDLQISHPPKGSIEVLFSYPPKTWGDLQISYPSKGWMEQQSGLTTSPLQGAVALQDVIQAVTGLTDQMSKLSERLNALEKKGKP